MSVESKIIKTDGFNKLPTCSVHVGQKKNVNGDMFYELLT